MNFFHRKQCKDEELNAEISSHFDEAIRDRIARGEIPGESFFMKKRDGLGDASLRAVMIAAS